jgi:hypothetical protein
MYCLQLNLAGVLAKMPKHAWLDSYTAGSFNPEFRDFGVASA